MQTEKNVVSAQDKGATLVEYALLVALIAVLCIAAVTLIGQRASQKFSTVASSLQ
jgi:pilus assembly protein Flp/PilA